MMPTVNPGEYVLIDKISPRFSDYQRGDIVVFQPPDGFGQGGGPFIKRVIGIPGDRVSLENGVVFVTASGGNPVRLDEPYVIRGADGAVAATLPRDPSGTDAWAGPAGRAPLVGGTTTGGPGGRGWRRATFWAAPRPRSRHQSSAGSQPARRRTTGPARRSPSPARPKRGKGCAHP